MQWWAEGEGDCVGGPMEGGHDSTQQERTQRRVRSQKPTALGCVCSGGQRTRGMRVDGWIGYERRPPAEVHIMMARAMLQEHGT